MSPLPVHINHPEEILYDTFSQHSTGWKRNATLPALRRMINRSHWSRQMIPHSTHFPAALYVIRLVPSPLEGQLVEELGYGTPGDSTHG